MFSKTSLQIFSAQISAMKFLGISNLSINASNKLFYCNDTQRSRRKMGFNLFFFSIWYIGMIIKIWQKHNRKEFGTMNLGLAFISMASLSMMLAFIQMLLCKHYSQVLNGMLTLYNHINGKFLKLPCSKFIFQF